MGDPDAGDGQGNCNLTRTMAAQAQVDWLSTDPTDVGDGDFLMPGIDDEHRVRQAVHILDATQAALQLFLLATQGERLLFIKARVHRAVGVHRLQLLEALDRLLDGLEVGQHATQPAMVDEGHVAALGLFLVAARGVRLRFLLPAAGAGVAFLIVRTAALAGLQATGVRGTRGN